MNFNTKLSLNILAPSFSLTICAGTVQAACIPGDCAALGYTKTESNCIGDIIRCPFDTTKVFCKDKPVCTENKCEGYPLTTPPQNAKYSSCTKQDANCTEQGTVYKIDSCNDGYVQNGNACESVSPSPEDPCAGTTCNKGLSCQYGCAEYTTKTSCCASVCKTCKPNPCDSVTCPKAETCSNGCYRYSNATECCPSVCVSCEAEPSIDADGCNHSCVPKNRKEDIQCNYTQGICDTSEIWETDDCGCRYSYWECRCSSGY